MTSLASGSLLLANVGLPMLALQMPILSVLAFPIVVLEAAILAKILRLLWREALELAALANVASTVIGVPITWAVLFGVEIVVSGTGAHGLSNGMARFHSAVLQAPWLLPYEADLYWLVPVANLSLLPFYFVASVFAEQWTLRRSRAEFDPRHLRRAAWLANAASYSFLLLGSGVWLVIAVAAKPPSF